MDKCGWNAGAQAGTGSGKGAREALCCRTRGILARQSSEFRVYGRWPSPRESFYTQKIDIVKRMRAADLGRRMRPTWKTDDRSDERRGHQMQDEVDGMMVQMSESRPAAERTVKQDGFPFRAAQHLRRQGRPAERVLCPDRKGTTV